MKANAYGTVLWQTTLPVQDDERFIVYDMKKGPNGLLLGLADGSTTLGRVVLLVEDGQICETNLGNGKVFSYHACPLGILAQGILYDDVKGTCAPQTTLVGMDGRIIFQYTGTPYEIAVDQGALTSSICCASDDSVFIVEVKSTDNDFQLEHELVSLDTAGKEKWRITLEGDMSIEDISVTDGNIYLVGFSIIRNDEEMPVSRSSMIRCYSDQGVERWQRQFDSPSAFYDCDAVEDMCIATSSENGIWYIAVLDRDGQIQSTASFEADGQYIDQSFIISNDRLIILGEMLDYLLIHSFSY